jgi:hypothetical protein
MTVRNLYWPFLKTGMVAGVILSFMISMAAAAEIGRVKRAKGPAMIERAGEQIEAKAGLVLEQSDVLVTGEKGRIAVTFLDNSRFSVGPRSRISLERFQFDTTSHDGIFETRIEAGSLAIVSGDIAKRTEDAMKVRTPTTILGMRGTRLIVEVGQ